MNKMKVAILWAGVLATALAPSLSARGAPQQYRSPYPYQDDRYFYSRLSGTYELDRARSDDPRRASDLALRRVPAADRARLSARLMNRLDPPEVLALDRSGLHVSMASSRAPEMTFDADGRPRTETGFGGRTMTTRASLSGDRLDVSTRGQTGADFSVTFEPLQGGNALRVTRALYDERLTQPVVVRSIYRKISDTPDWDVYSGYSTRRSSAGRYNANGSTTYGATSIPEGTILTATLDQPLTMRTARADDRMSLTVRNAPRPEWEDATIEGYVTGAPSTMNGRTNLSVAFDQIRFRDGRTLPFDGDIRAIAGPNGEPIAFNGEQVQSSTSQNEQAIQRGAIGAALGALIGAIAGGGKGAAIGAVLGGGGAAATVMVDDLSWRDLPRGTQFTIRARQVR